MKYSVILFLTLFLTLPGFSQNPVRFMTYNIKYDAVNDTANNWSVRKPWVAEILKYEKPDVLGVQEALLNQVSDIKGFLDRHARAGVGREDGANGGEFSAIFYDSVRFTAIDQGTFWLSDTPDKVSVGWDAALPRVSTFVILRERNGASYAVYNAHLDHIGEESRRNAIKLILKHARENHGSLPLVLMGDFNFTDDDEAYESLISYPLSDSRMATQVFGPRETFNGFSWDKKPDVRIDYIFASEALYIELHKVVTTSFPPRYPSDHFPVIADILLK